MNKEQVLKKELQRFSDLSEVIEVFRNLLTPLTDEEIERLNRGEVARERHPAIERNAWDWANEYNKKYANFYEVASDYGTFLIRLLPENLAVRKPCGVIDSERINFQAIVEYIKQIWNN